MRRGPGVEAVLDQFLDDAGGAFDDFAGGDLVRHVFGKQPDAIHADRPFAVKAEVSNWHDRKALLERVRAASGCGPVLWQYVPHMYGRGGVNFAVPGAMAQLAREGRPQVVLAHEIRAPFSLWPHRTFYAMAHRLMWRRVRSVAQAIGISTSAWLERERGRRPDVRGGARVGARPTWFLAPSPSNIPVVRVQSGHRQAWREGQGLGVESRCLGFFGSVGSGKQFEWVLAGWREARRRVSCTGLVVLGRTARAAVDRGRTPMVSATGVFAG
jgi:hypothetical protein